MSDFHTEIRATRPAPAPPMLRRPDDYFEPAARASKARGGLSRAQERRALSFLTANAGDTITIVDIAAACGLSPSHFSRAFRESVGKPPHRWLIEHRVARAKQLLLGSELSIVEIAADCGFADQSHFTRLFNTIAGLPPGSWRRRHRP